MTSKPASTAARSKTPFRRPSQRCARTVLTSWPMSSAANAMGSDSSINMRTANRLFRELQCRNGLLAAHRRKFLEELIQRIAGFEIVKEVVEGNPRADEYQFAAHDLGIAV